MQTTKERAERVLSCLSAHVGEHALAIVSHDKDSGQQYLLCRIGNTGGVYLPEDLELIISTAEYAEITKPDRDHHGPSKHQGPLTLTANGYKMLPYEWATDRLLIGDKEIAAWVEEDVGDRLPFVLALDIALEGRLRSLDDFKPLIETVTTYCVQALQTLHARRDACLQDLEDDRNMLIAADLTALAMDLRSNKGALDELNRTMRLLGIDVASRLLPSQA